MSEDQHVTNASKMSEDATGVPQDTGAPEEPQLSAEEQLSNSRAEAHELFKQLQAEREKNAALEQLHEEIKASLDPRFFTMEEKERRFNEDRESLGLPKITTPQADPQSSPKTRHVSEEEMRAMTLEQKMALNPRSLKRYRPY